MQHERRRMLEARRERAVAVSALGRRGQEGELPLSLHRRHQREHHREAVHGRSHGRSERLRHRLPDRRRLHRRDDHPGEHRCGQRDPCKGREGVCYIDAGGGESFRPDFAAYNTFNNSCGGCLFGRPIGGFRNEYWLNINNNQGQRTFPQANAANRNAITKTYDLFDTPWTSCR
jgi:hypothetical protein